MRQNRRLLWSWIIALGFVALGVLANCYLVYTWSAELVTTKETHNPYQKLYDELLYPSVRIVTGDGIGSGVIISHHRGTEDTENTIYILTAAHVVGDEALVTIELFHDSKITTIPAFVVATDTGKDLAILRITNHELRTTIYPAKLAPRDYVPYIFTPVWVIGCSLGYPPRPTAGEITTIPHRRDAENAEGNNDFLSDLSASAVQYWEMNAPIWPGNSGGGVFLKDTHELIGIAVWVKVCEGQLASTMGGIVPLQTIYEFLERHQGTE